MYIVYQQNRFRPINSVCIKMHRTLFNQAIQRALSDKSITQQIFYVQQSMGGIYIYIDSGGRLFVEHN